MDPGPASAQTPHLTGTVDVDMTRGLITGGICVSNLPPQDSLRFVLHSGLNIESIRDVHGRSLSYTGYEDGRMVGEGLEYTVGDTVPALRSFCVRYTGAFPIYCKRDKVYHSKALIAFDGETIRATEESKWYPVLYDPAADWLYENVTYRLRVTCRGCASIYVNGDRPRPGPDVLATSAVARPLLLLAGDFAAKEVDGTWYLNSAVTDADARAFGQRVAAIKQFYQGFIKLPYRDRITFLEVKPVFDFGPEGKWAFTTWPTIAFAGRTVHDMLQSLERNGDGDFLAHEMAHYYFGTVRYPRGPYFWFFLESTTEYLALKALQHFGGDDAYRRRLRKYYSDLDHFEQTPPVPLDRISVKADMDDIFYRYRYGPLLLVALEHEIGRERMAKLLHGLLTAPAEQALDYKSLGQAARSVGVPAAIWDRYTRECIEPAPTASCLRRITGEEGSSRGPRR